jgi:hypothetical protein
MPRWLSIEVICPKCGETTGVLTTQEEKDGFHECASCGCTEAERTFSVPNVSTSKTSETIPDVVAKGRFAELRAKRDVDRELSRVKKEIAKKDTTANRNELKRARKEAQKFKKGK